MYSEDLLRFFMLFINDTEGRETFVMQLDKPNEHITMQVRHRERLLDLHKTTVLPGGHKTYETLLQVRFYTLYRLFAVLRKEGRRLEASLKSFEDFKRELGVLVVNPGWLRRNYMEAMDADAEKLKRIGILRTKNRGRQVRLAKAVNDVDIMGLFKPVHCSMDPGMYILIKWHKGGGASFAGALAVMPGEQQRFLVATKRTTNNVAKRLVKLLLKEFGRLEGHSSAEVHSELRKRYPAMAAQ